MDHTVVPGYSYAVTASEDCTLTAANGWKLELKAGIQQHFTAQFDTFTAPVPITLNVNFNSAPAAGGAGGVSEDDLVTYGVLQEVESLKIKARLAVNDNPRAGGVKAKGFAFLHSAAFKWLAGCNGVNVWLIPESADEDLLGMKLRVQVIGSGGGVYESAPLSLMEDIDGVKNCFFYFPDGVTYVEQGTYVVTALVDGKEAALWFASNNERGLFASCSWNSVVSGDSAKKPLFSWLRLVPATSYAAPAVDSVPTEGSVLPVSSGGVFSALAQLAGGGSGVPESREDCEWVLAYRIGLMGSPTCDQITSYFNATGDIATRINQYGGICLPLGDYAVLIKRPAGWKWDSNEALSAIFNALTDEEDLAAETRFIYFNLLDIQ